MPIEFNIRYNSSEIDARNRYSITARIIESDGRLAFTNDTAYEVITRGNPGRVDMLLVLVQPPPGQVEEGQDWRSWVETPVFATQAYLVDDVPEPLLRIGYFQSAIEGCARPGNEKLEVMGTDLMVSITLMQPPDTPWGIPCDEEVLELDAVSPIESLSRPDRPTG